MRGNPTGTGALRLGGVENGARHLRRAPLSSVVVVSSRAVKVAATHTAFLEICVPSHRGTDHCCPTSLRVPYRREPRGKPRFTLVSDGKPLRPLLVLSKSDSFFMALLLPDGFARHITKEWVRKDFNCSNAVLSSRWVTSGFAVTRQQQQRYLCTKSAVSAKAIGSNAKQDANASQIIRRGVPSGTDIFRTAKPTTSDRSADASGAIKTAIPS